MAKKDPNQFSIRFPKTADKRIIKFLEKQSNKADSLAFLIEQEILNNGIRNLQEHIPAVRELPEQLGIEKEEKTQIENNKNIESSESSIDACFED